MGLGVGGDDDTGVPEKLLDDFEVRPGGQHQGGRRVTQVVRPHWR
jgi:hypothetical protein